MRSHEPGRSRLGILAAGAAAAVAGVLLVWAVRTADDGDLAPDTTLDDLAAPIAAGLPAALDRARTLAARDWSAAAPAVGRMLAHESPLVRAAACDLLAARGDGAAAGAVFARASDRDWRVRAAAMTALARHGAAGPPPVLRDAPLEDRERWLLTWLDACALPGGPTAADLCELYAGAGNVEFGPALVGRCLRCHAGARPGPPSDADTCKACHPAVHAQWAGSAHAQSLTHLRLATVNPATRQPEAVDFGPVRGIGCFECHPPADAGAAGPGPARDVGPGATSQAAPVPRGTACPYRFGPAKAGAATCTPCHATTAAEWQVWQAGRQPRRAVWPPGQIDLDRRGDRRDCVACHMPRAEEDDAAAETPAPSAPPAPPRHDWPARRDVGVLASGVHLAALPARDEAGRAGVRFVFTNLAGHTYPTGSRRRVVRLYAGPEGEPPQVLAALSPVRVGGVLGAAMDAGMGAGMAAGMGDGPPLAPGEQKVLFLPAAGGAGPVGYRLMYFRDAADPQNYVAEILRGTVPLGAWPGP